MPSFLTKEFLRLPVWAWLLAGVITAGAVVYFVRTKSPSGSATGQSSSSATGTPTPTYVPLPFANGQQSTSGTVNPSGQQMLKLLGGTPPDMSQWTWNGSGWFPRKENLPPGWAWGQGGAYTLGGGPAYGHFVWTGAGWLPSPSNPPPDWQQFTGSAVLTQSQQFGNAVAQQ